jgi:hypothetical protein
MLCNVFALSSGRMNKIILGLCPCSREAFAMYIIPLFTDHTAQVLFIIAIKNPHYNLVFQVFGVHTTRQKLYMLEFPQRRHLSSVLLCYIESECIDSMSRVQQETLSF